MSDHSPQLGLRLERLRVWPKSNPETPLVDLSLTVAQGEVLTLMGPSGVGKSTALSALLGSLSPEFETSGSIWVDGRAVQNLPPHRREIGLMFQDDILFPHLSVGQNLGFALAANGMNRTKRKAAIDQALADAGLAGFADRDPASLSGGQRSRISLMRSLLAQPKVLLLDEPFSRLDADLRATMRGFVFDQIRARAIPAVMVTHDADDAAAAGGPVISPLGKPL